MLFFRKSYHKKNIIRSIVFIYTIFILSGYAYPLSETLRVPSSLNPDNSNGGKSQRVDFTGRVSLAALLAVMPETIKQFRATYPKKNLTSLRQLFPKDYLNALKRLGISISINKDRDGIRVFSPITRSDITEIVHRVSHSGSKKIVFVEQDKPDLELTFRNLKLVQPILESALDKIREKKDIFVERDGMTGLISRVVRLSELFYMRGRTPLTLTQEKRDILSKVRQGEIEPIRGENQKDAVREIIAALRKAKNTFQPKKLKKAVRHNAGVKAFLSVKWENVASHLEEILAKNHIFIAPSGSINEMGISLGDKAIVLSADSFTDENLFFLTLVKYAHISYMEKVSQQLSDFDMLRKASLTQFGLYFFLTDMQRDKLIKVQHNKGIEFLKIFHSNFSAILKKPSTDAASDIENLIKATWPDIETEERFGVSEGLIPTMDPHDSTSPFAPGFLRSSESRPLHIRTYSGDDRSVEIEREGTKRRKSSLKISIPSEEVSYGESVVELFQQDEKFQRREIKITVKPDSEYKKRYVMEIEDFNIRRGTVIEDKILREGFNYLKEVVTVIKEEALKQGVDISKQLEWIEEFSKRDHKILEKSSEGIEFVPVDVYRVEEDKKRQIWVNRNEVIENRLRKIEAGLTLENTRIVILAARQVSDYADYFQKVCGEFQEIGFKDVQIVFTDPNFINEAFREEDIIIVVENDDALYDHSRKVAGVLEENPGALVFDFKLVFTRDSRRVEKQVRQELWRVDETERIKIIEGREIDPYMMAELIARKTIPGLVEKPSPLVEGKAKIVELPPYESNVRSAEDKAKISVGIVGFSDETARKISDELQGKQVGHSVEKNIRYNTVDGYSSDFILESLDLDPGIASIEEKALGFYDVIILKTTEGYDSLWKEVTRRNSDAVVFMLGEERGFLGVYHPEIITEWEHEGGEKIPIPEAVDYVVNQLNSLSKTKEVIREAWLNKKSRWKDKMKSLIKGALTFIQVKSAIEEEQAKKSRYTFPKKPSYYYSKENRPFLVFEGLTSENGDVAPLKEGDEIHVVFEQDREEVEWSMVISEIDQDRIVCPVPRGMVFKKVIPKHGGGYIKKIYNDVSAKIQQRFLRDVIDVVIEGDTDWSRVYPLVRIALGLESPEITKDTIRYTSLNNASLSNNAKQMDLLSASLNGSSIELGWGPPGTGKTTLAAEVMFQNHMLGKSQLIAAQTNRAVDNLLLKAKESGLKVYRVGNHPEIFDPKLRGNWIYADRPRKPREPRYLNEKDKITEEMIKKVEALIKENEYLRDINMAAYQNNDSIEEQTRKVLNAKLKTEHEQKMGEYEWASEEWLDKKLDEISSGEAIVGGTCVGIAIDSLLNGKIKGRNSVRVVFKRLIVEEASVASIAELLIVLGRGSEKALIIGDPNQLGLSPIHQDIKSSLYENKMDEFQVSMMETSLFEFLLDQQTFNITMLEDCYRMTPLLVELTNFFYEGRLRCMRKDVSEEANRNSLIVIDTKHLSSKGEQETGSSWSNKIEIEVVKAVFRGLAWTAKIDTDWVGIITPYSAQIRLIREEIKGCLSGWAKGKDFVDRVIVLMKNIGTAWPFQGREKPVIVVSFVRSNPSKEKKGQAVTRTGFMGWHMMNVITSRGQECTIVILDSETFLKSQQPKVPEFTRHMIELAKEKGVYVRLHDKIPLPALENPLALFKEALVQSYEKELPLALSGRGAAGKVGRRSPADKSL